MKTREIPALTRAAQLAVSDPAASAWVSANAGSGKTYVLAQRVIRLLLRGTPPGRILCLTFTKAAAAHMANQVLKTLRSWVSLSDEALDLKLAEIDGKDASSAQRMRARQLFATALETPGGLKVQTIHAFCDRVLHQFPFEAHVPPGFEVLDETTEADLLQRARAKILLRAARESESDLGKALALAVSTQTDMTLANVFDEVVRARRKLRYLLEENGLKAAEDAICSTLGLSPDDEVATIEAEILDSEFLPRSEWASIAEALVALGGNPARRGLQLAEAANEQDPHAIGAYLAVFLTNEGNPRQASGFGAEKLRDKEPVLQRLIAELGRLVPLVERRRAAQTLERSCALNLLGRAMIGQYEAMKEKRGALDYDDLVNKAVDLLENQAAAWVHYKLDGGIDHILIDEAQDTSPEQWKVVNQLTKEFFAGKGASDKLRTIFAVGDEKQSIFSFQGADPKSFDAMRRNFEQRVKRAELEFHPGKLDLSFRSAPGIVKAVDEVFGSPERFRGLSSNVNETHTIHTAIRNDAPALVEVWDTVKPAESEDSDLAWDAPLDAQSGESAPAMLAQRIAKAVTCWLNNPSILVGDPETETPRAPHAGDIIVLVRSRGPLFDAVLRELKQAKIPVAGADRLQLAEHIAVMDIAALCDVLLLPSDDFSLACALKSPLFGFDEEELFAIAHGRAGTLEEALNAASASNAKFAEAAKKLTRWRREARALQPFDFLTRLLGRDKGRELILARLGFEATDALDELLQHALAYEATGTPSLTGFLSFLRRGGSQVKRDLEVESRAVRVMTVHGVKGLEAPIVVLADTTSAPDSKRHHPKMMQLAGGALSPFVWTADSDCAAVMRARENIVCANEDEYRRLLYVALTRARDALIVCGYESRSSKLPDGCWYSLVRGALEQQKSDWVEVFDHGYGFPEKVFRWRYTKAAIARSETLSIAAEIAEPSWLRTSPPTETLSPSLTDLLSVPRSDAFSRAEARKRGILIHRLLQELPRFDMKEREARAKRYLERFASDLSQKNRATIINEAVKILTQPELAEIFGPRSRAEVPILGRWSERNKTFEDFGRVDRLVVTKDEILIADFKSDASPPPDASATPKVYLSQLARYSAILRRLYPGKAMRAFVIWTANGAAHEIPEKLLA